MSTVKDILVANFLIKAALPIVGLGALVAMCASSPNVDATKPSPNETSICQKAVAAYDASAGSQDAWTAQEIACRRYTSTETQNPNIYKAECQTAVNSFLAGKEVNLESACWPERVAAQEANSPECKKLKKEYDIADAEADLQRSMMEYRQAAIAESDRKLVENRMVEEGCAF